MSTLRRLLAALAVLCSVSLADAPAAQAAFICTLGKETTATVGTGTLTVSGAVSGYKTLEGGGVPTSGTTLLSYGIVDGSNRESGWGTYDGTANTLTRCDSHCITTNANSPISLSGAATVACTLNGSDVGPATTSIAGVSEFATAGEYRIGTDTGRSLVVDQTWAAAGYVTLTDAATIAVDMSTFINANVVIDGNRTLGDPSNEKVGQSGLIKITATTSTRTLALGSQWTPVVGVETFPISIPTTDTVYIAYWVESASLTRITGVFHMTGTIAFSLDTLITTGCIELGNATDTSVCRAAAGEATIEGDVVKHAGKQTIWMPAGAMTPTTTSPAGCQSQYDSGTNDLTITTCDFDTGATEERVDFQIAMPKNWNEGSLTAQFLWTNTAGANSSVAWEIGCAAISDNDTLNTTMGTTQIVVDAWLATNNLHTSAETSAITCGGTPAEGDLIAFRINRDTSNASDAMAGDARLIGVKVFYTDNAASDD